MANMNIRAVPEESMRKWKAEAARKGLTLREWVMERLEVGRPQESNDMLWSKRKVSVEEKPDRSGFVKDPEANEEVMMNQAKLAEYMKRGWIQKGMK